MQRRLQATSQQEVESFVEAEKHRRLQAMQAQIEAHTLQRATQMAAQMGHGQAHLHSIPEDWDVLETPPPFAPSSPPPTGSTGQVPTHRSTLPQQRSAAHGSAASPPYQGHGSTEPPLPSNVPSFLPIFADLESAADIVLPRNAATVSRWGTAFISYGTRYKARRYAEVAHGPKYVKHILSQHASISPGMADFQSYLKGRASGNRPPPATAPSAGASSSRVS